MYVFLSDFRKVRPLIYPDIQVTWVVLGGVTVSEYYSPQSGSQYVLTYGKISSYEYCKNLYSRVVMKLTFAKFGGSLCV